MSNYNDSRALEARNMAMYVKNLYETVEERKMLYMLATVLEETLDKIVATEDRLKAIETIAIDRFKMIEALAADQMQMHRNNSDPEIGVWSRVSAIAEESRAGLSAIRDILKI